MEEIIPGLWIGDLACALATDYLSLAGVTHVVTAMKQALPSPISLPDGRRIEKKQMYHVNIDDVESAPILVHLPGAVEFINEALDQQWIEDDEEGVQDVGNRQEGTSRSIAEGGNRKGQWATMGEGTVLVHCQAGISRSVAIVCAYLMRTRSIPFSAAIELIQSRRSQADPNPGFRLQLELYESASFGVDVRNQRIRRFLMSQSSILKGDPIDDVMLSYYPSPFHSPAASSSGSLNNGVGNLQLSTLDGSNSDSEKDSHHSPGRIRTKMSRTNSSIEVDSEPSSASMSRQSSRRAAAAAAASQGARRSRANSRSDGQTILNLSKSPPMPENATALFDALDQSQSVEEDPSQKLIREKFSSVKEDHEVMITIAKGKLPGGVTKVIGNQGKTDGDERLPTPHFRGLKLRCRMCRRELAARDHIVEHEEGRGKDAFDVRKREKDGEAKSKNSRSVKELGVEQLFGARTRRQATPPLPDQDKDFTSEVKKDEERKDQNGIKSAASLSAQLPPHLAALRQGRIENMTCRDTVASASVLQSAQCSAYFVEPLAWMSGLKKGDISGRLECPNGRCSAKLGSWDWAGMQCACGAWVTPAFALHRSKVDEVV